MNNIFDDIFDEEFNKVNVLSNYSFEYGILSEDGIKKIKVDVLNPDETTSTVDMDLSEIMYFVENGSVSLVGKHILEKSIYYFDNLVNNRLSNLIDEIIINDIDKTQIENKLNRIALEIENQLKLFFLNFDGNSNLIENIIDPKEGTKEFYNLKELSKYIKCKVVKNK